MQCKYLHIYLVNAGKKTGIVSAHPSVVLAVWSRKLA